MVHVLGEKAGLLESMGESQTAPPHTHTPQTHYNTHIHTPPLPRGLCSRPVLVNRNRQKAANLLKIPNRPPVQGQQWQQWQRQVTSRSGA